jgi:8-oxo-dGTP pyrophosphatase MutT (NUDIX family)
LKDEILKKLAGLKQDLLGKDNYLVSAVLLPLIKGDNGMEILFEVRSRRLERQPGEICFPGGRVEDVELDNPGAAALREAAEELGLKAGDIRIIAPLDFLTTPMGVVVYPYVGEVLFPERIVPNREEVESLFTVPLAYLLENPPQVSHVEVATRYGEDFPLHRVPERYGGGWQKRWSFPTYIYEYGDYFIWGITAIILHHFINKVKS